MSSNKSIEFANFVSDLHTSFQPEQLRALTHLLDLSINDKAFYEQLLADPQTTIDEQLGGDVGLLDQLDRVARRSPRPGPAHMIVPRNLVYEIEKYEQLMASLPETEVQKFNQALEQAQRDPVLAEKLVADPATVLAQDFSLGVESITKLRNFSQETLLSPVLMTIGALRGQ